MGDFSRFSESELGQLKKWFHQLYPERLKTPSSSQSTKVVESPKERLQRLWNQLNTDEQVDWKNQKPPIISPEISFWMKHYCEFASEEEMYCQDFLNGYTFEEYDNEMYHHYIRMGWIEDDEGGLRDNDPFSHT